MAFKMMAIIITLTLFIIISATVNALTPVCNTASDKALCSKMTNDAPTWSGAMYNAINYELAVVKKGRSIAYSIGSKLPGDLEPSKKQDVIDTCNNLYNSILENLKKALGFVKKDPYPNALQGAISGSFFQGCIDEFEEVTSLDAPAAVAKFNNQIQNNNGILLGLVLSRPNIA